MIANGNTYCKIASFGPILPHEYQEVEYLEFTGTQYINTNILTKQTLKVVSEFSTTSVSKVMFGARKDSSNDSLIFGYFFITNQSFSAAYVGFGGRTSSQGHNLFILDGQKHKIILSDSEYTIDNINQAIGTRGTFVNFYNIYLGTWNNADIPDYRYYVGNVYSFKIYDNNSLILNLIPCYRKSDNEIGMYDTVNKVFYTNQGTGTFLKGNNVVHTIRYKIPTEERPYISGHVTDGSSTFTFKINGETNVTVPVDSNGNWKWYANTTITYFNNMFNEIHNIDFVEINSFSGFTGCSQMFRASTANDYNLKTVIFKNCDFSSSITLYGMFMRRRGLITIKGLDKTKHSSNTTLNCTFQHCESLVFDSNFNWNNLISNGITNFTGTFMNCKAYTGLIDLSNSSLPTTVNLCISNANIKTIKLPQQLSSNCNVDGIFTGAYYVESITAYSISKSMNLKDCNKLTKQSVLSLINAASASISYTLNSTVYNKCASGGDWYTDIQAAIDAKAQQGYTVTLISA